MPLSRPSSRPVAAPRLALLLTLVGGAAQAGWEVSVRPGTPEARAPMLLRLEPDAGQACPASISSAERHGSEVVIDLMVARDCGDDAPEPLVVQATAPGATMLQWGAADVYRVSVFDDGGAGGARRLVEFSLVEVGTAVQRVDPEAGFWWNEAGGEFDHAGPGFGLALEAQQGVLSVNVFGYRDDGTAGWWLGAGAQGRVSARFELVGFEGGSGPFRTHLPPSQARPAGQLHLHLLGPARATAWFERPSADGGISLEPLSLVRFRFGEAPGEGWLGRWVFIDEPLLGVEAEPPFAIEFDSVEPEPEGFRLVSSGDGRSLSCRTDRARPNSPPSRCVLRDASQRTLVDFSQIAIHEMFGWRGDGARIRAMRPVR